MIRGHDRLRARFLSGCAATEGEAQRHQACKPLRREPGSCRTIECSRKRGCARSADRRSGRHRAAMTRVRQGCRWSPRTLRAASRHVRVHRPGRWIRGPPVLRQGGGDHRCRLLADLDPRDPGVRCVGRVMQAPLRSPAESGPARQEICRPACVHKPVDHLCKTAPNLCTSGGNAGDPAGGPPSYKGL